MQRPDFGKRKGNESQNSTSEISNSDKETSVSSTLADQESILLNINSAEKDFKQEFPMAVEAIKSQLQLLETEFSTLQSKIKESQKENKLNVDKFKIEIFTLKETKCDRNLNALYYKAQAACDDVGRYSKWGLSKDDSESWLARKKKMENELQIYCKNPIKDFSKKISDYAESLGLKKGFSAQLEPQKTSNQETPVPNPLFRKNVE